MAKKTVSGSTTTKSPAKALSSIKKLVGSKTTKPVNVNVRERLKELEKKHIAFVESVHKIDVETDFVFRKAQVNFDLELRAAPVAGEEGMKLSDIEAKYIKSQYELQKSNRDSKKELADNYLKAMKEAWSDLQQSDVEFSKLGELGFFFSNLTSEAVHLKDHF